MESRNNADRQPAMNLQIAQVYLQHGNPALSARTWQNVMDQIIATRFPNLHHARGGKQG